MNPGFRKLVSERLVARGKGGEVGWGVIGCGQIAIDKTIPALLAATGALLHEYYRREVPHVKKLLAEPALSPGPR